MRFYLNVIAAFVLTVLVVSFSVQNAQQVQVTFFRWYFQGSLVIVLLLAFVAGLAVAWLTALPGWFRRGKELRECRSRLRERENSKEPDQPSI